MEVRGHGTQLLLGLNVGVIFYMSQARTRPEGYLQIRKSLETRKSTDHRNLVLQERKPRTSVGVCAVVENHRLQTPSSGKMHAGDRDSGQQLPRPRGCVAYPRACSPWMRRKGQRSAASAAPVPRLPGGHAAVAPALGHRPGLLRHVICIFPGTQGGL